MYQQDYGQNTRTGISAPLVLTVDAQTQCNLVTSHVYSCTIIKKHFPLLCKIQLTEPEQKMFISVRCIKSDWYSL